MKIKLLPLFFLIFFQFNTLKSQEIQNHNILKTIQVNEDIQHIAYDGEFLWTITTSTNENAKLKKISTETGNIVDVLNYDLNLSFNSLTYWNNHLWVVEYKNENNTEKVHKINPSTGNIVDSFDIDLNIEGADNIHGICFNDGLLYISVFRVNDKDELFVYERENLITKYYPEIEIIHGITHDGTNFWITSNKYVNSNRTGYLHKMTDDFRVLKTYEFPQSGGYPTGLAWDGVDSFWSPRGRENKIHKISFKRTLSADNFDLNNTYISLYPNPTTGLIKLKYSNVLEIQKMNLYQMDGKLIKKSFDELENIDISSLSSGSYLLKIKTNSSVFFEKIIKR